jgi:hypothetical protein
LATSSASLRTEFRVKARPQPWLGSEPNVSFAVRTGSARQTAFYGNCWWWK